MTEKKFDANEVAFLELELEAMRQQEVETEYPLNKALTLLPVKVVPAGAESYAYAELDLRGHAKWLAKGASDVEFADIERTKQTSPLHRFGAGFQYSFDDIKAAQMAGMPIDANRRRAAREIMDNMLDDIAAGTNSEMADLGLKGLASHPDVTVLTAAAAAAGGNTTPWDGADKTPLEILADMNNMLKQMQLNTKGRHRVTDIVLPVSTYEHIRTLPLSNDGSNSDSVLSAFGRQNPGVNVSSWNTLENADAAGTGQRAIAYEKSPMNLEFVVADPIAEDEPEREGRSYKIRMTAKVGGVALYRPLTVSYMDGV